MQGVGEAGSAEAAPLEVEARAIRPLECIESNGLAHTKISGCDCAAILDL
ncbi:protein of unknown function [Methylorubrum extorquens]|uniref:Uncharacterized protein n=1 Tax=Methylorubrum extorquens TaxID=408 RepID=A0A2N9ASP6_METEX|nr:protein of unknown function [Methylorubrum extorquens]